MRRYLSLLSPLLVVTFSSSFFLLLEKLLLARISVQEMEVAVSVAFICQIFQTTCVGLAMMVQVNVAQWVGEKSYKMIGPGVWQFIWFSMISIGITLPIGIIYGSIFLERASLKAIGFPYFCILLSINFLYPLGTALSCFYLGQGKTKLVLLSSIGSQLLKVALACLLILGWGWVPSLGLMGAALSTLIAQGGLCLLLFMLFIRSKYSEVYQSRSWRLQPQLFWHCVKPGLLRAVNRLFNATSWSAIAWLVSSKGGDYLVILSIGGALVLFIPFIGDAICQTQTIIASQMIGARQFSSLWKSSFNGIVFFVFSSLLLAIPLVGFPVQTYALLFPDVALETVFISRTFLGIWFSFVFYTLSSLSIGYILAFKDMLFSAGMGAFNWVNGFLVMYIALEKIQIAADFFWLTLAIMHASTALIYFFRARKLCFQSELASLRL